MTILCVYMTMTMSLYDYFMGLAHTGLSSTVGQLLRSGDSILSFE